MEGFYGATATDLHLSVYKCPQISGVVSVPDVNVVRRNVEFPVSGAEELQLGQADL